MALEIILAIVPTIIDHTIRPVMCHISYPFKYKSNVENLDDKVDKLKTTRDRVQHSVDEEKRNGKLIEKEVEEWLHKVEGVTERLAGERIDREERAKKRCFGIGFCPNPKIRYLLSKKAEKEALAVAELEAECQFAAISYRVVPSMFVGGYNALESRISVVEQIMHALMVPDVNRIGVHGMGGVGKTTVVKQVARQATEEKLFDAVVMAAVTQTPDIRKIQGQIADMLGLKFEEESEWGRAGRLRERLKQEKKVLLVLDDLWERIDLEAVGVPSKDEHKGCKILLTSRDLEVLLGEMGSQTNFFVDVLPEEEAWNLFKNMAGDNFEDAALQSIAAKVAKECACLPVAIVTVARAMKNKGLSEWKKVLRELRRPSSENFTGLPKVMYSCIELSYNHLESKELKSIFVLCSLMGYNSSIRNLLKYSLGLGLFPNIVSIEEAQDTICSLLLKLKASCLLLENDSSEQFAMHDVVRDVAISIAARDHQVFVGNNEVELNRLDKDMQKKSKQIWLRCHSQLLQNLECPQLELFQLFNGDPDLKVPNNFFEGMQKLKVLHLTNFSFSFLPSSLHLISNLQTLCLDHSVLGDITVIGDLKNLETLSFVECSIKQLPREISQLTKLKVLDLSDCSELEVIPSDVFSKLSLLEELYMGNSFHQWHPQGSYIASIADLENLTCLSNLDIHIQDPRDMSKDMFSERLQRYRIFVGDVWDWDGAYETLKTLKLKLDMSSGSLEYGVEMLLKRTEDLHVLGLNGVKNIICELDWEGFPQLKHLHLRNSPQIQYIIDATQGIQSNPFPVLESLILDSLVSLEKIYHGALEAQLPFRKLKILEVENCLSLKNLFSFSVARCLLQLQNFKVSLCPNMEEIFIEEGEGLDVMEFTQLRFVSLQNLQHLSNFCSQGEALGTSMGTGEFTLRTRTPLFNEKIVFPNLEDLELNSMSIEKLWHHQLPEISLSVRNLQRLIVNSCNGLKYIFSATMVSSLLQIKHLCVCNCKSVEEIIVTEGLNEEEMMSKILFPKLDCIELIQLPKLTRFCVGYPIECPLLKRLSIKECTKLNTFVSEIEGANMTVSNEAQEINSEENCHNAIPLFNEMVAFPSLDSIEISNACMEKIWHSLLAEGSFCELRSLKIEHCYMLVNIFPPNLLRRFQRLVVLEISSCHSFEEIFDLQGLLSVGETNTSDAFQLRDLRLYALLSLKHVWNKDPQGRLSFQDLNTVTIGRCEPLKSLFPCSIAKNLPQLEELEIWKCCCLEEIVEKEENGQEDPCFVFPRMTTLKLEKLGEFKNFYSAKHTWQCPILKTLAVVNCGNVKIFGSECSNVHKIHGEVQLDDATPEPLFLVEKVISNLEELSLDGRDSTTSIIWNCQLPTKFYSTVKVLKLQKFQGISDPVPFGFLRRLQNLETLSIKSSYFINLFLYESVADDEENLEMLPRLRNLMMDSVYDDDVRHLWDLDHRMVPVLENLGTLEASGCSKLVILAPSSASFQDLTTLDVFYCSSLLYLITSSTARSLGQLVKLTVSSCYKATQIVAEQEDETKDEIVFSKLEYLGLFHLKNLTSFCSGNNTFRFPSLKEMAVEKCPKMMIFSPGLSSTPKLLGVHWERSDYKNKVCWQGNLNNTIRQMYTDLVGESSQSSIRLSDSLQLKETWHVQPPLKVVNNLLSLTVDECPSFSIAIPSDVLQVLSNLKDLEVSNCDSLVVVFDLVGLNAGKTHAWLLPNLEHLCLMDLPRLQHICNTHPRGILDFKSLKFLIVQGCGNLRNIFTPSVALGLVQLVHIGIFDCGMMEEIITEERSEEATAAIDRITLPSLNSIILRSLPNLTCIYPGNVILEFPSLERIEVSNCPKMKAFITSFLRGQEPNSVNEETERRIGKANHDIPIEPRFNYKVVTPTLKTLGLDGNDILEEIRQGSFRADFFCNLKVLDLARFSQDYVVFPSHFLGRFTNLEKLIVRDACFEVIIQHKDTNGEGYHDEVLQRLRELKLYDLPKLVHLSKEDSLPCLAFRKLETLKVRECGSLKILAPSAISFQCLVHLRISECDGLIKLMTSSTAKFLVKLKKLDVSKCQLIEEIVANKDNEVQNEIILHELTHLSLDRLPSLTSFCLGDCPLMFPALNYVYVMECPNMEIFSQGVLSTPKLDSILLRVDDTQWNWEGDLNTTIHKMFIYMGGVEQSKLPSSQQATLVDETTQAGKNELHAISDEGLASDGLLPDVEPTIETKEHGSNGSLKEPEMTQLASTYHEISDDKEDHAQDQLSPTPVDIVETFNPLQVQTRPQKNDKVDSTQDQNSPTPLGAKTQIPTQVQMDTPGTQKDQLPLEQVVHASSSIDQKFEVPKCPANAVKHILTSASASPTKISTYEQLTSATANFEPLHSRVGKLLNSSPASSSESIVNLTLACETTQVDKNVPSAVSDREVYEDLHVTMTSETSKDLSTIFKAASSPRENRIKAVFGEPEVIQLASRYQDFHATLHDKEDPMYFEAQILQQVNSPTTGKDGKKRVNQMDVDDLLALLEENQALVSRGVISPVSSPRTSSSEPEVDEKEVNDRIEIVKKVLAGGPESLCFYTSIEVVQEALEFLCVNPVDHLVSSERMEVVKKLFTELDDITRKVRLFAEVRSNLETLKETHRIMDVSSREMLDEIRALKEASLKIDADIVEAKEGLRNLEQQVAELKNLIAAYDENATKESAKLAAKAREALDVQEQAKGVMEQIQSRHPNYQKVKKELKAVNWVWDAWKTSFGL